MFLYQQFNFVEKQFIMEVLGNTCMVEFIILRHIVVSRKQINYNNIINKDVQKSFL